MLNFTNKLFPGIRILQSVFALGLLMGCIASFKSPDEAIPSGITHSDVSSSIIASNFAYLPMLMKSFPVSNIFGAQLDTITPGNGLNQMVLANSAWTRRDFLWRLVEPIEGQRNWDAVKYYEDELITAKQNGINVVVIISETPGWARLISSCGGKVKPEKLAAFASFVHDLVVRYNNPPFNVNYFEMWNEPDVDGFLGCWGDVTDRSYYGGKQYGDMLKVVYPAAKAVNPGAQILVGGLLLDCDPALGTKDCTPANYLKGILESGAQNSFDGIAFHSGDYYAGELGKYYNPNFAAAWNTTGPVSAAKAKYLRGILSHYNVTDKYLLNSESGIKCGSPNCADPAYRFEETKAYYIVQDGATALAGNYRANIWYSVYGDRYSGLLDSNNQPLPSYYAFQFMSQRLMNYAFSQNIMSYPGVKGYEFLSPDGKKLWLLWSLDGISHQITLPGNPSSLDQISPAGSPSGLPLSTTLSVGFAPIFVQFN